MMLIFSSFFCFGPHLLQYIILQEGEFEGAMPVTVRSVFVIGESACLPAGLE